MMRQRGAALLLAMLTVALVATISAAAMWQQWRSAEVEAAERQRLQASWILIGALDWSRLLLREDARNNQNSGAGDHLGEPWATPLEEARLSSFLAADRNHVEDDLLPAFLSGSIVDLQSRLNFRNLVKVTGAGAKAKAEISASDAATFTRLFELLNLPQEELSAATARLLASTEQALDDPKPSDSPLLPQRYEQLRWLGLSESTLLALEPHVTVLPERTPLNLNTASAEAMSAAIPGLDQAIAQQVVALRLITPFRDLATAISLIPGASNQTVTPLAHDVRSRFFEVRARLRLDDTLIEEHSLVQRNGLATQVRWRERVPAS
ncbi:MAG: type II secretion system minor pseudopilin GspK [Hydrogenophaga sp.]|nr:type II secretion system minor pseudopilin GspK [Hydrogenophaga sp.]